jgi:hypothetical protein
MKEAEKSKIDIENKRLQLCQPRNEWIQEKYPKIILVVWSVLGTAIIIGLILKS